MKTVKKYIIDILKPQGYNSSLKTNFNGDKTQEIQVRWDLQQQAERSLGKKYVRRLRSHITYYPETTPSDGG